MSVNHKKTNVIMKTAIIIGVLVIPLLYSYFYLNAFWDPYARLNDVPVAVVNLDKGAKINHSPRNVGSEICEELKEKNTVKFIFTEEEDARNGVLENKYYAAIIIPDNLSASISTASENTEKVHGQITYIANQKKNYLAAQILENAMPQIKESVNGKIDEEIISTLCSKLNSIPDEMGELQDGLGKLYNGSSKLNNATAKLNNGADTLNKGSVDLADGSKKVNSGAVELKNGLLRLQNATNTLNTASPVLSDGIADLNSGANTLSDAMTTIAANNDTIKTGTLQLKEGSTVLYQGINTYTAGVTSASDGAKTLNNGLNTYTDGVATVYTGAQKLTQGIQNTANGINQIASEVDKSILYLNTAASESNLKALDSAAENLKSSAESFSKTYNTAINYLTSYQKTGNSSDLAYAMNYLYALQETLPELAQGTSELNTGVNRLTDGMRTVKTNTAQLHQGLSFVQDGIGKQNSPQTLLGGAYALEEGLKALDNNAAQLKDGMKSLNIGLDTLTSNNKTINDGAKALNDGAVQIDKGVKSYTDGVSAAANGAKRIKAGTNELDEKAPQLVNGISALANGADSLVDGAGKLTQGTQSLFSGADTLNGGTDTLKKGTDALLSGTEELKNGISTADMGVDETVKSSNKQLKALEGLPGYASEPVVTKTSYIQPVENYGSAFAPYFMGLSLWVGGLMIFFGIYLDYHKKLGKLTKDSKNPVIRQFGFIAISSAQGILLAVVIKYILEITVNNTVLLFLSCWLVSLAFMAIIQFCIMHLQDAGKFIALLLLILQLTSCAGTFPIETQSGFFKAINKFLPMTYSTLLFKEAISGEANAQALKYALIILLYMAAFLILSAICILISKNKNKKQALNA